MGTNTRGFHHANYDCNGHRMLTGRRLYHLLSRRSTQPHQDHGVLTKFIEMIKRHDYEGRTSTSLASDWRWAAAAKAARRAAGRSIVRTGDASASTARRSSRASRSEREACISAMLRRISSRSSCNGKKQNQAQLEQLFSV